MNMSNHEIANKIIKLQDELYSERGYNSAPNDKAEYDECIGEIRGKIIELGLSDQLNDDIIEIVDNENAHMAASAAESVLHR